MNLIKLITSKLNRKPSLINPAISNLSFSKDALETMFLAGFTEGRANCPVCSDKPENWRELFQKQFHRIFGE